MLYVLDEEGLKTVHIPGFPGSKKNIPSSAISLCDKSCITPRCASHKKNPGGCGKEKELRESYQKIQNKKIIEKNSIISFIFSHSIYKTSPIFSFTSRIVSRAILRARSAPLARISLTYSGLASSSFRLARNGAK